ncbi:MAG: hypothetical protein AEth_01131 [Candidatus Argoarchaeum ethanivorans]|uniref:Fibronectin type-III domain-containing protein n=1 Tax=Candidatus Argoarchaeum ethanivorans TaxID=2608793 RepID=A0A8B3S2M1_9EURY|nr:MAG: hypothetical protein AEth_01131 [Candidatus Argoarchaeum ethanivorans]
MSRSASTFPVVSIGSGDEALLLELEIVPSIDFILLVSSSTLMCRTMVIDSGLVMNIGKELISYKSYVLDYKSCKNRKFYILLCFNFYLTSKRIRRMKKPELKIKLVSLLIIAIMLCSLFAGAVTAENKKDGASSSEATPNTGNTGYEPWYYYAAGGMVNIANGNLYLPEKDISIKARGFDLEIIRAYNSHSSGTHGPFGFGWTHNYNIHLVENDDGSVTYFDRDGSGHTFPPAMGNNYTAPPGIHSKLTENPDGSFVLWLRDGSKYNFGSNGKIINITDKNDNHLNFEYNIFGRLTRISDDSGLFLNLNYNLRGRISSVADPLGREINYEYEVADLVKVTDAMGKSTLYEYCPNHKLESKLDLNRAKLIFTYYSGGKVEKIKLTKQTAPGANITYHPIPVYSFSYATDVVRITDGQGYTTKLELNSKGNPIKITDPSGGTTKMEWDSNMDMLSFTDANCNTHRYDYDTHGNTIKIIDPLNNSMSISWAHLAEKNMFLATSTTDKRGFTTYFEYDDRGNVINITDPNGNSTYLNYTFGYVSGITDFRGFLTEHSYDSHGNMIEIKYPVGNTTRFTYDLVGRRIGICDANNNSFESQYDDNDRVIKTIDGNYNETTYSYDATGTLTSMIDSNGHETKYSSDSTTGASGDEIHFDYEKGKLVKVTNPEGRDNSYKYDALGRVISSTDPLGYTEKYTYDKEGNIIKIKDKNGNIATYSYDKLDRLIAITAYGNTTKYTYDENGNFLSKENDDVKISYTYDASNRVVSETTDYGAFSKTVSYTYDESGNRIAMIDPDGNVTGYEYDKANRLMRIEDPSGTVISYQYDGAGRRIREECSDTFLTTYAYDGADRLLKLTNSKIDGEIISSYSYAYDAFGNRLSMTNSDGENTYYEYDDMNRLIEVKCPDGNTVEYTYDGMGNRLTMKKDTLTVDYTYDENDRLTADGTTNYTYDKNGNLIIAVSPNGTTRYEYGLGDRIVKAITTDGTKVTYGYSPGPWRNRVSKAVSNNTTYFVYDFLDMLMELDEEGNTKAKYIHGSGLDEPVNMIRDDTELFYLYDGTGSVTSLINSSGNIVEQYKYDAFGVMETIGDVINPYTFTGREYDRETGLYYYRARYYDAKIGRFLSEDQKNRVDISPYVYADNNPVNFVDPFGDSIFIIIAIVAVIGIAGTSIYAFCSSVKDYAAAFERVFELGQERGRIFKNLAAGHVTPDNLKRLGELVKDGSMTASQAAWALYTSIPGTLATGPIGTPTSMDEMAAAGLGKAYADLMTEWNKEEYKSNGRKDGYKCRSKFKKGKPVKLTEKAEKDLDELEDLIKEAADGDFDDKIDLVKKIRKIYDNPDDNFDVATFSYSASTDSSFDYKSNSQIPILLNGFFRECSNLLVELGESITLVDIDIPIDELNDYPILIIPSGGFFGIDSLPSFNSKLENYVSDGGTLIVFSQQHGYEFDAVPGDWCGYGWAEDQSCQHRSVGISNYHPILSGQDSTTLNLVVDGYFTSYPENATILLTRTKNGMPAMLMYEYGNGTVIVSTAYTDWAYGHNQATKDGENLLRDIISWAKEPKELQNYSSGDFINIPINITSCIDLIADKVEFEVFVGNEAIDSVDATTSAIPPYGTKTVNFVYTVPSNLGIYHVDYLLVNDSYGEVQRVHGAEQFEVSKYAKTPGGFIYRGSEISLWITTPGEYFPRGNNVTATYHVKNDGDTARNVSCSYGFWHKYDQYREITVDANSEETFTYTTKVLDSARFEARYNSMYAYKGLRVFNPSVDIGIETEKKEYAKGEDVYVSLNLTNNQKISHNVTVTIRTLDPDNKKIYEDSFDENLSAYESTSKTPSFSLPFDSGYGTYIVTAETYENGEKIGSNSTYFEIPRFYRLIMSFNRSDEVYCIRQNMSLLLNISNTGSSVWNSWVNTSIPSLSFFDSKFVSLNPDKKREIEYESLSIPTDIAAGKHDVFVNLSYDNSTKKDNFFIPCSDLIIGFDKDGAVAGGNISFNISNVGGVDTVFNCSFKLVDWKGKLMHEDVVEDTALSLANKTLAFGIPDQSVNGSYYLFVTCKDKETGKEIELAAVCEVNGLNADLTSDTERKIYFKNENVSILTNITNLDGEIVNGTLHLKIVRTSMPSETKLAPAKATAKLLASYTSSTAEEEESQIEEVPSSSSSAIFSLAMSLYNFLATASAASPLANITPAPTPEPEPEPAQSPKEEFNESYGNESVIKEPVPLPSQSPPTKLTTSPEEPVQSPPINVTPTSEPEEELNETYNPSVVKLSDIIIGNETVWKDEVKILSSNLIINSTGNLTLINTQVFMDCTKDRQYHIEVQNGGEMHISDSEITAKNTNYEYCFQVKSGAKFEMHDSELHECGYTWGINGDLAGLWINTNDTIIENNLITNNYYGIVLFQSNNNTLTDNIANSNYRYGISLKYSNNNTLTSNIANWNKCDHGILLSSSSNNTLTSNIANSNDKHGIYLKSSNNNTLTNSTANSNDEYGICLSSSSSNTLTNSTANSNNEYGIYLSSSSNNTLTNNTANSNHDHGIYLSSSNNNTLTNSTANSNKYYHGIYLSSSNNNTLTSNTANSNDDHGISLSSSSNNTLTNNTAKENSKFDLFIHATSVSHCNNKIDNTTGSGDRPIRYFNSSVSLSDEDLSELILCNADHSDINNITVEGSSTKKNNGILLVQTDFSNLMDINSSNNYYGIYLKSYSCNNSLTNNTMTKNSQDGIYLRDSCTNNTIKNNSVYSNSHSGIYLNDHSNNNTIINNSVHSNSLYGGIYLNDYSNNNAIENNTISSNSDGISFRDASNNAIENNTISSNSDGISFGDASNNNAIENNVIKNNKYKGVDLRKSHNNRIISNNLTSNQGHGIELYGSSNNVIEGNSIEKNKETGIFLSSSNSNKIISNTVISNNDRGIHLYYWRPSHNNNISGNNVSFNSGYGIAIGGNNNILTKNIVYSNDGGINLYGSTSDSILENNTINSNSGSGITISASSYNTLSNNSINNNKRNFGGVFADHHDYDKHFNHSIDTSNTVNGKPIYYLVNEKDKVYDETANAGYFAAILCENITVKNLNNLTNNSEAVFFRKTYNSSVENISGTFNSYGIHLWHSDNNTISNSNLSSNSYGVYMRDASGTEIHNCNLSSNSNHGLYLKDSSKNNQIDNCNISSNSKHGAYIYYSTYNRIDNCDISANNDYGLHFYHSGANKILNSEILGVKSIKLADGSTNCEISNNSISSSDRGIYIYDGSAKIFNNTINADKEGIYFYKRDGSVLRDNTVTSKSYPLYFGTYSDVIYIGQDIDLSNTFNGYKALVLYNTKNESFSNLSFALPKKNTRVTNYGLINLYKCENINIENATVVNHSDYGFFVYKSNVVVIENSTASSNENGIKLWGSRNELRNSTITNNTENGIYAHNAQLAYIVDNEITHNKYGVYPCAGGWAMKAHIQNNTIENNERGIYVDAWNTTIDNNIIKNNSNYEIYCRDYYATIENNTIITDKNAIYLRDSKESEVINNSIVINSGGKYGIYVYSYSCVLKGNKVSLSGDAMGIQISDQPNTFRNNNISISGDAYGFYFNGYKNLAQNFDATNTVNGVSILVLYSKKGTTISNLTAVLPSKVKATNYGIINLYKCKNVTIENVAVANHSNYGIYLSNSNNNTIRNSRFESNSRGVHITGSSANNELISNTMESNSIGVYCGGDGNIITKNVISSNSDKGIYLCSGSDKNNVVSNRIMSNNYGCYGHSNADYNLIYDNLFDNTINAYADDNDNIWNITKTFADGGNIIGGPWLGGNYWSDYHGEDLDGDELADTPLPYNCSGRVSKGGDCLPLVMPLPPKEVLWEKNITINLAAEGETKNIVTEVPASVFEDATGKQKLSTTLYSNTTQIINIIDPFFYITPKNTSLTLETDKMIYKPNETVLIYVEAKNHAGSPVGCNLSIKKDSVEIFNDSFTLAANETRYYTTNTTADAPFTLEGTVDGVVVMDSIGVESPEINASIIAPDVVGLKDFDVGVLIENIGNITAELNVSLDSKRWNITVPEGESQLLETTMNTSIDMTITVVISGDVNETKQRGIICDESAKINITPEPTYLEGEAEISFTINNTGAIDSEFNATFSISSPEEQNITKHFFVPKGENITESISFNLTKGAHLLRYTSPFEEVDVTINILSPPELNITSIYPEEMNFTAGEDVTFVFKVKNIGGSEGEAVLALEMPDFEDTNRTWIRAGDVGNISFNFIIPDDLEEKSYKGIYELDGKREEFTYLVRGANISVDASLDKNMYEDGETAVFTLEIENKCKLDLSLYSRVKFNEYDNVTNFNLTGSGSKTLTFNIPVTFTGDNKILYTVYMNSGRALYINSMYIYEENPEISLYTDRDVYNVGEDVRIHINVNKSDRLNLTAPKFAYNDTISGPTTLNFTLLELRSGTYYVEYTFGNLSFAHPFDVIGYHSKVLEANLYEEVYYSGETLRLGINIEANRNISGLLRMWIYDPENVLIDEFEMNKTLTEGENEIEMSRTLLTNMSGIHVIVYGFYADLSGHSLISLASGAEYFDASPLDAEPPVISNVRATGITTNSAVISWETDEDSDSLVKYGTESGTYTTQEYDSVLVTFHSITLTGLSAETIYYYVVNSTDSSGNSNESVEHHFTTLTIPPSSPNITSFAPPSPVNDAVCHWRMFNVTVNQTVNVSWYLNNSFLFKNESVTEASCTLHAQHVGENNVSAVASNANGTDMQTWVWNVTIPPSSPNITSFAPPSPVRDTEGATQTFNVTINQIVNVSWQINGTEVQPNVSGMAASYTNTSAKVGTWNVSAIVTNANGTNMQTWIWTVGAAPSPCYIATATYATPLDRRIDVLRDFRDEVLMTNPVGETFVSTYYATSPPIANALRANDGLRTVTRLTLITPLVYLSKIALNGILLVFSIGLAVSLLIRRDRTKILKSLLVGAGSILVFIAAIFSLGSAGYAIPFCAGIGAYLLPFVIPVSVGLTVGAIWRGRGKTTSPATGCTTTSRQDST